MSAINKRLIDYAIRGLDLVGQLVATNPKGKQAEQTIEVIKTLVARITLAFGERNLSAADLKKLTEESEQIITDAIAANDKAARAYLDRQFPTSPTHDPSTERSPIVEAPQPEPSHDSQTASTTGDASS